MRSIATLLGRSPSTISRDIKRNGGQGCYQAIQADQAAWDRALRPKSCKLVENPVAAQMMADKLQLQWSPEQIAGWLKRTYPHDASYQVSQTMCWIHMRAKSVFTTCIIVSDCLA